MRILLDVSNEEKFKKQYTALVSLSNIELQQDSVSYGKVEYLVVGLNFLYESGLLELSWEIIKSEIYPYIKALLSQKRKYDHIVVSISDGKDDYDIPIPSDYNSLEIEIPEKLRIKFRK